MDFCVFILSHGRADRVHTYNTLRKQGYTGEIHIVCDDEDDQIDEYKKRYGDFVHVFNKQKYIDCSDVMTNDDVRNIVLYARNYVFDLAKELGYKYFIVCDDDYCSFRYRYEQNGKLLSISLNNLDEDFKNTFEFMENTGALVVAWSQGGDLIGGINGTKYKQGILRKAMNIFFCSVDKPFEFLGAINEDTNMYVTEGQRGKLIMTYVPLSLTQIETQANAGGLTDIYKERGTYYKSIFSVMCAPSCVKIALMRGNDSDGGRIHHRVEWDYCTPQIINEKWRK